MVEVLLERWLLADVPPPPPPPSPAKELLSSWVGITLAVLALVALVALAWWRRRGRKEER